MRVYTRKEEGEINFSVCRFFSPKNNFFFINILKHNPQLHSFLVYEIFLQCRTSFTHINKASETYFFTNVILVFFPLVLHSKKSFWEFNFAFLTFSLYHFSVQCFEMRVLSFILYLPMRKLLSSFCELHFIS